MLLARYCREQSLVSYFFALMTESTFDIAKFKMLLSDMIQTKIPDLHFNSRHAPYLRDLNGDIAYLENF